MFAFLEKLLEPKSNAPETAMLLADVLQVRISRKSLKKDIEEHPDYPSLLSISDALDTYGIENLVAKFEHGRLLEVPPPFITLITGNNNPIEFFTVVKKVEDNTVEFFDPEARRWTVCSGQDFLKRSAQFALLAEPKDDAGEKDFAAKHREEKRTLAGKVLLALSIPLITVLAGGLTLAQEGAGALLPFAYTLLALMGALVSVTLLWYELDQHNPALRQICSGGKKVNCSAIIKSGASRILNVSWSEIGAAYFAGQLLLLLLSGITSTTTLFMAAWLSALAIPYTVFSIYYQWRIARQWCVLCLTVQGILVLQLTVAAMSGWHALMPAVEAMPGLLARSFFAFAFAFVAVMLLQRALQRSKQNGQSHAELQRLKRNPQIFETVLKKQKEITASIAGLGITLGNPDAPHKIVKVCNPYCGPCARAHTEIEALLARNPDVQMQIIFTATSRESDERAAPVKHFLAIAAGNDHGRTKQALDQWYHAPEKNYDSFAASYPMNGELKEQHAKLDAMAAWCDKTGITFTPTIFVNGFQLPETYGLNDLDYFFRGGGSDR